MTTVQYKKGQELLELIKITEGSLNSLKEIKPRERLDGKFYEDNYYNLYVGKYSDGSSKGGKPLSRYYGNERLLAVIIRELEVQLKEFKDLFDKL